MKLVNGVINDILDTVFGKVYIATTSANTNMFNFMYDLIVLACYIFMFKHFCSFLTNLLTSMLKFDGSGFSNNADNSSGSMFGSNIVSQFAGAMGVNKNNWEKLTNTMSNTIGFRRFGQMAGRFTPFDGQGNLSFRTALKSVPDVKKRFNELRKGGEFKGLREKDEKKAEFLEARKKARQEARKDAKDGKELNDLFNADKKSKEQMVHNANKFMNNDIDKKQKDMIKNQEIVRYKNSLATQIDKLSKSYQDSLNNNADKEQIAELKYKLEEVTRMAVNVDLIDEKKRNDILSGHMQSINKISSVITNNKFRLHRFNSKKNVDTIINLSKLAQQGLIDASLFTDMNESMIEKWANGKITKGEYERVMRYMESHDSINKINENIKYADRDDLSFNDLMMYEEIYLNQDYIDGNGKDDGTNKNRSQRVINAIKNRKNATKKDIVDNTISLLEEQLEEYNKEIQMGLSDKDIELSPEEADIAALVGTDFEKSFKSFEEECIMCAAVENNPDAEENKLTQQEEDTIKHGESMLKVTGIKLKIEEFNKQKYQKQIEELQLELESSGTTDNDKQNINSKIKMLKTRISTSDQLVDALKTKQKKINKRISAISDKKDKKK